MRFCDNCGSFLRETKEGLLCPKCKKVITAKPRVETRTVEKRNSAAIFVADKFKESHAEVSRTCPKCGNTQCEIGEFRAAGGFLSKVFDIQSKRFTTVICTKCQYTEIYRASSSMLGNIFDLFTN